LRLITSIYGCIITCLFGPTYDLYQVPANAGLVFTESTPDLYPGETGSIPVTGSVACIPNQRNSMQNMAHEPKVGVLFFTQKITRAVLVCVTKPIGVHFKTRSFVALGKRRSLVNNLI